MNYKENFKFFFLNQDFGETRTGIENSSFLRARLFKRYLDISPIMVTAAYNPFLNIQRTNLHQIGLLDMDFQILNMYEHFQKSITHDQKSQCETWKTNGRWIYKPIENTFDYKVYDEDINLVMYRKCDNNGLLMYNNIFVNKIKVRRDTYDSNGYLSRTQYLDPVNGKVCTESYYRIDGSICIYKYFQYENDKNNLLSIQLINNNGELIEVFKSETDLISYWLEQVIEDDIHNFLIIDKERVYYPALLKINKSNVTKVCMIHNLHLQKDQDIMRGKLNYNYREIFEELSKPDAVVLLTNRQKEHIVKRFGPHDNLFVIPHSIEKEIPEVDFEKRLPLNAIHLARYSEEKQHNSLVRVFHKVVQKYPSAQLNLYGHGNLKDSIINQIRDLGLESNVIVNDFVDSVDKIYDSASLSILTSRMEGFSLFILESITHGCPVVSYDVNYGASDMIDDSINGYIIEMNNEDEMAEKIIELFGDREKLKSMSEAAYKKAKQFKSEIIANKWLNLIEEIIQRKSSL